MRAGGASDAALIDLVASSLSRLPSPRLGLAVSGGGDSMALLWLVAPWARQHGIDVRVATVDHGLRPEALAEARFVAGVCAGLGLPHDTLSWRGWDGRGNLQAAAREARRALLADWARGHGIGTVLLGHTQDDQAETLLMRLARGSGVDGLSGMAPAWREKGVEWRRPLLRLGRGDLRDVLRRHGRAWVEDPTNEDGSFARVRARRALACLSDLGVTPARLSEAATHLRQARRALEAVARDAAERVVSLRSGDVVLSHDGLRGLEPETEFRLWTAAIRWVSSVPYRPRRPSLEDALAGARLGRRRSLGGALIRARGEGPARELVIGREPRAVARTVSATTALWDGRWRLTGSHSPDLEVRCLGQAGLALCPDWRDSGLGRSSVLASPAVWRGGALVAAPLAGRAEGWRAEVVTDFLSGLGSEDIDGVRGPERGPATWGPR